MPDAATGTTPQGVFSVPPADEKATVPVGTSVPVGVGVTTAVNVTGWVATLVGKEETKATVVGAGRTGWLKRADVAPVKLASPLL